MTGINDVTLRPLDGMSIEQMIDMLVDLGYSADEIYSMLIEVLDGHDEELEELDFSE